MIIEYKPKRKRNFNFQRIVEYIAGKIARTKSIYRGTTTGTQTRIHIYTLTFKYSKSTMQEEYKRCYGSYDCICTLKYKHTLVKIGITFLRYIV